MTTTMPTPPDVTAVLARVLAWYSYGDKTWDELEPEERSAIAEAYLPWAERCAPMLAPLFADARAQSERIEALAGEWLQYARVAADLGHPPPMMTWASAAQRLLAALTPDTETPEQEDAADAIDRALAPDTETPLAALTPLFAQVWDESAEATADWMANNPGPSGIPHDPPSNPYEVAADRLAALTPDTETDHG